MPGLRGLSVGRNPASRRLSSAMGRARVSQMVGSVKERRAGFFGLRGIGTNIAAGRAIASRCLCSFDGAFRVVAIRLPMQG